MKATNVWPTFVVSSCTGIAYIRFPRYTNVQCKWNIIESGIKHHIQNVPNQYIRACGGFKLRLSFFPHPPTNFSNYNERIACNTASDEKSWNPFSNATFVHVHFVICNVDLQPQQKGQGK